MRILRAPQSGVVPPDRLALNAVHDAESAREHPLQDLSVVVPVRSISEPQLKKCLESLRSSLTVPCEILVAEGGNPAQNRNLGVKLAQARYVAFIDSDCEAHKGWPSSLLRYLESDDCLGGVGGPNFAHPCDAPLAKMQDIVFSTYLGSLHSPSFYKPDRQHTVSALGCANSLFRKKALTDVGGFDERFELNEDTKLGFSIRAAGYTLLLVPEDPVWHRRRESVAAFARQMFTYGAGRVRSMLVHMIYADSRILIAFLASVAWLLLLLLSPTLGAIVLVLYVSSCIFSSVRATIRHGRLRDWPLVAGVLVLEHASYFTGMVFGFLKGPWRQPGTQSRLAMRLSIDA